MAGGDKAAPGGGDSTLSVPVSSLNRELALISCRRAAA